MAAKVRRVARQIKQLPWTIGPGRAYLASLGAPLAQKNHPDEIWTGRSRRELWHVACRCAWAWGRERHVDEHGRYLRNRSSGAAICVQSGTTTELNLPITKKRTKVQSVPGSRVTHSC